MTLDVSLPVLSERPPRDRLSTSRGVGLGDRHGRRIGYLRLSLTRACSMRCVYCRPDWDRQPDRAGEMTAGEIERLTRYLVETHGVRKVRLTGGDPTSRRDLVEIVERIARIAGVEDLAMTTNGLTLGRDAARLRDAGLGRVNVSLDSLDNSTFARLTGVDGLPRVLAGIEAARAVGFDVVKVNTVVVRGENDEELPSLVRWAAGRDLPIRFIELMPMGPLGEQWAERYVSAEEMRARLDGVVTAWDEREMGASSARMFDGRLADGRAVRLGFITPMSCNFCAACDRLRVAADGSIYPCLMDEPRGNLMGAVQDGFDGRAVDAAIAAAYAEKQAEHPAMGYGVMTHIGG